ncbi:DUF1837 domain-containing protein [Vibrio anguillarum]|nr:DUF1837 domain-containing protein [Vibrio anguillarum]MBF4275671.1 DUF1837 domain-containing protein [Vibrio anguillarum]MBF4298172.1 DUF1837 domain-containing protein [Vibrio anguillarum]MBF4361497.1 DUF1837 domain-containing protein [Vibrio anguillarum]MBF4397487.1 DUF1837 domain-containing protein [Vibrio anguillarum]
MCDAADNISCFQILELTEELKNIIRNCFQEICHGSAIEEYEGTVLYSYKSTLSGFLQRYRSKPRHTQIGLIGELLSHVLLTKVINGYEASSAYFNLEEKSIKKGFDILLCKTDDNSMWITEVKSGELHKDKDQNQTTQDLLNEAKRDLNKRLNEQEPQYWLNAINHVRATVSDEKDYKKVLIQALAEDFGSKAVSGTATSKDKNVILVSNLFSSVEQPINKQPAVNVLSGIDKKSIFNSSYIVSIQKSTFEKVVNFLIEESE